MAYGGGAILPAGYCLWIYKRKSLYAVIYRVYWELTRKKKRVYRELTLVFLQPLVEWLGDDNGPVLVQSLEMWFEI